MRAIQFDKSLKVVEHPKPDPADGEALIRVEKAGICRTDIEITEGYMGFSGILGHEFVGRVEKCDSNPELVGKRVVGEINIAPWTVDSVNQRHDPERTVLGILNKDGCFADYVTLPAKNLFTIDNEISLSKAVFVEPLAAAYEILEQINIPQNSSIIVIGDGKLGLLVSKVLRSVSKNIRLLGKHADKLAIATAWNIEALHVDTFAREQDNSFEYVIDCAGKPEGLNLAMKLVKPRGTIVLKTTTALPPDFHASQLVINEITLVGSRCGPFPPAIEALEKGIIDPTALIEAEFAPEQAVSAFELAKKPGALKVLFDFTTES